MDKNNIGRSMNLLSRGKTISFLEKLFLLGSLLASGSLVNADYSVGVIVMMVAFSLMLFMNKLTFKPSIVIVIVLLSVLWVVQLNIYSPDADVTIVFKYTFIIFMCMIFSCSSIQHNKERLVFFTRLVLFFSVISSALYFLYILNFPLPLFHTKSYGYLCVLYLLGVYENPAFGFGGYRSSGIFWEPGLNMVFLNFILLIYLFGISYFNKKERLFGILASSFFVFTAGSITGYLLCFLIWGLYLLLFSKSKALRAFVLVAIIAALPVIISTALSTWELKLDYQGLSYEHRNSDMVLGYELFLKKPVLGYGAVSSVYQSFTKGVFYTERGNSNGIMQILLAMGMVGALLYTWLLFNFTKLCKVLIPFKSFFIPFFLWVIISLMNEPFALLPFMFLLLGFGVAELYKKKSKDLPSRCS